MVTLAGIVTAPVTVEPAKALFPMEVNPVPVGSVSVVIFLFVNAFAPMATMVGAPEAVRFSVDGDPDPGNVVDPVSVQFWPLLVAVNTHALGFDVIVSLPLLEVQLVCACAPIVAPNRASAKTTHIVLREFIILIVLCS